MARLFLDSSVIIAGISSTTGASHIVLELSRDKKIRISISEIVIQEVVRNLKKKLPEKVLIGFFKYLAESNFKRIELDEESEIFKYQDITDSKDVYVIAAAFKSKANYLVTLDKKHLLKLKDKHLPFKIVTPAKLIKIRDL